MRGYSGETVQVGRWFWEGKWADAGAYLSVGPGKWEHGVVKSLKALGCCEDLLLLGPHSHTQLSDMT